MAERRGLRRLVQLVLDRRAAKRMEDDAQRSLDKGTDPRKAERNTQRVGRSMENLRRIALRLGGALAAAFGVRALIRFGRSSVEAAQQLQAAQRTLAVQLENTGISWNRVGGSIRAHARALWETHRLTEGEVMPVLQNLIAITGDYERSLSAVGVVADVAAGLNMDVATAARLVGRVMNGETTAMTRYGIAIEDGADAVEVLRERFGGMAKEATTAGEVMGKAWGDFKEAFGAALLDASRGESIMDNLTTTIRAGAENMDDLVAGVKALVQAIMIAGALMALNRMRTAIIAANAATITWRNTLIGLRVIMGPKGWLVLGIAALATAIHGAGRAARDEARHMRDFRDSVQELTEAELRQAHARNIIRRQELMARRHELREEMRQTGTLSPNMQGVAQRRIRREQVDVGRELNRINGEREELHARIMDLRREERDTTEEVTTNDSDTNDELAERIRLLNQISPDAQTGGAATGGVGRMTLAVFGTRAEGFRARTDEALSAMWDLENTALTAARGVERAWSDAFAVMFQEGGNAGDFLQSMFQGVAQAGLGALSQFASAKVAENIAMGFQYAAQGTAAASTPGMQPFAAGLFAASKGAFVAAAKWAVLAGGAMAAGGAVAGGGRAGAQGMRDPAGGTASNLERETRPIYITVDPFNPKNPVHQDGVSVAFNRASQRQGTTRRTR